MYESQARDRKGPGARPRKGDVDRGLVAVSAECRLMDAAGLDRRRCVVRFPG
jgi:hypothetical protein